MGDQNLLDKSMRSVFVGNIPYEATEEKLKDIFNEVGPVLSFKLVYDRETGKPKGYGFCEYKDQETALSAMRNLNGYEIGGRMLRVDNACTEKSRLEMQSLMQGPPVESQYGEPVSPEKAPEAISKAVASLPPEQMFELMRQMKLCVQNNPTEARQMLLQNPQLAYALLQAQVVMRIVDPQVAITMLQKANPALQPLMPVEGVRPPAPPAPVPPPQVVRPALPDYAPPDQQPPHWPGAAVTRAPAPTIPSGPVIRESGQPPLPPQPLQPPLQQSMQSFVGTGPGVPSGDMDMRALDPRIGRGMGDQDLRMPPQNFSPAEQLLVEKSPPESFPRDPRGTAIPDRFQRDPRAVSHVYTGLPMDFDFQWCQPRFPFPQISGMNTSAMPMAPVGVPRPVVPPAGPPQPVAPPSVQGPRLAPNLNTNVGSGASDQEKAALIMQVLQLSDDQIAMLPPEQRQSILVLKEQIAKSTQR